MKISAYSEQTSPDDNDLHVIVRSGTTYKIKLGTMLEYTPTTPGDWGSPAPTGIKEALDVLAAGVAAATIADGDYGDIVVSGSGANWVLDSSIDFTGKQLNNGTWDNPVIQNGIVNDCAIDTISSVDVNALVFSINDNADPTKQARFVSSGIAAGTVRSFTFPNASGTLALTSDLSSGYQPLDSDLTTIAGLTATTDNFIQAKSSAWASRTPAQVATDLQGTGLTVDMVGFRGIPQNSQSAAYTTVAADAGKHIHHPSTDANARTFTIDSNANVAYPIGTAITFTNRTSQVVTIAITSDTMYLAGTTSMGSRSLAENGIATALKVNTTTWIISGSGLS